MYLGSVRWCVVERIAEHWEVWGDREESTTIELEVVVLCEGEGLEEVVVLKVLLENCSSFGGVEVGRGAQDFVAANPVGGVNTRPKVNGLVYFRTSTSGRWK